MHWIAWALTFALLNAGNNIAVRIAIMAITTRSSMSVNAWRGFRPEFDPVNAGLARTIEFFSLAYCVSI